MKKTHLADLTLLIVAFIWGSTFVVVQNAISFLEPHSFNMIRFFLAALILSSWLVLFRRQELKYFNKKILLSGLLLGFWLFIGYGFQTLGLTLTTSSKAGFITGLSVVLVPIFSMFFLKSKPNRNALIGVALATLGLYLLTMSGTGSINMGDFLIFICAIGFAMQIIFTGKYTKEYPTLLLTVIQISSVALFSGISAFLFENWREAFQPKIILIPDVIIALLITSVLATAFAFFAQTYFQKYTSATHTALIFAMEPVFAAITGVLWAGDIITTNQLIGSCFILIGMILAELPGFRKIDKLRNFKRKSS